MIIIKRDKLRVFIKLFELNCIFNFEYFLTPSIKIIIKESEKETKLNINKKLDSNNRLSSQVRQNKTAAIALEISTKDVLFCEFKKETNP